MSSDHPVSDGRRRDRLRRVRRFVVLLAVLLGAFAVGLSATGAALVRTAETNLVRRDVSALVEPEPTEPVNILVVGSDSRAGLTAEEIERYHLGSFEGRRSDTVMLVSVPADRSGVSVLSFPRDLRVLDDGRHRKLTETFDGGPDDVVDVIADNFGIDVHHYVEVSVTAFLTVVDTIGGVEVCLEEPLVDAKSGADFEAGCQRFDAQAALAYVRSRQGGRGDYERIERQQAFVGALVREVVAARTLIDLPRLFALVEDVAGTVVVDPDLSIADLRRLAEDLRGVADGTIPMTALPSHVEEIDGTSYVVAYEPGADALLDDIRAGRVLVGRGSREERAAVTVGVWTGGSVADADRVARTLHWSGFGVTIEPGGPDVERTPTVFAVPGHGADADLVGAALGAPVQPLPGDVDAPEGATVVVAVEEPVPAG